MTRYVPVYLPLTILKLQWCKFPGLDRIGCMRISNPVLQNMLSDLLLVNLDFVVLCLLKFQY